MLASTVRRSRTAATRELPEVRYVLVFDAAGLGLFSVVGAAKALGIGVPLLWCFVFGALISPTDPVAVMGVLKRAAVPPTTAVLAALVLHARFDGHDALGFALAACGVWLGLRPNTVPQPR